MSKLEAVLAVLLGALLSAFVFADDNVGLVQRPEVVQINIQFAPERVRDGSFRVDLSEGSGVIVSKDSVLTNWHVIRGYNARSKVVVILKDKSVRKAQVLKIDRLNDLALLRIEQVFYKPVTIGDPIEKGDHVTIAGFKGGNDYTEVSGNVVGLASVSADRPNAIFRVNNHSYSGMSGGGVFNDSNELVGILFGSLAHSYCIDIEKVRDFLKE